MVAEKPVQGVAKITMRGLVGSTQIVNVFHTQNGSEALSFPYTQAGLDNLCTQFGANFKASFGQYLGNSYQFRSCDGQDLSSDLGVQSSAALTGNATGGTDTSTPLSTACCISWKISRHYRGGHPRTYLGPISGTNISTATSFGQTFLTGLQAAANGFLQTINAITIDGTAQRMVCVHRLRDNQELGVPQVDHLVNAAVDSRIDTQRRRLGRDR